ncbi:MAG TPA: dTDP-4-dehydrorhamnose 3,5-epimerase [Eubacteriales bacterium]|nr:dTDP-4-dehydrorhamnose 3,5-epimerase [Clostridia bacterium]HRV73300.1 dTDP-4-dehydrorhamnose 3,5-epimerase [Eubacteriales bacterium]
MPFSFIKTEIDGLLKIVPHLYRDERGLYKKYYEKDAFAEKGITCDFTESSDIRSGKGVLRGLHYQSVDAQAKLIHVIKGMLFDVALDLRVDSPTFGEYHAELLNAKDDLVLYVPENFAHGFLSLTDETVFSYQCSGSYRPEYCGGILWNDPALAIAWPLHEYGIECIIATDKDKRWPTFSEYVSKQAAQTEVHS